MSVEFVLFAFVVFTLPWFWAGMKLVGRVLFGS
jgi:hypothetical protein